MNKVLFFFKRLKERLWVRPLIFCILSVVAAFVAKLADYSDLNEIVPEIEKEAIELLLTTISASMLVISTFAVASMISAYSAASTTATPRSFALIISDDVSQNALSAFIGAFIFSIVGLIALKNSYYDKAGLFTIFALLILVFAIVILTFVRWVDRIARLGRMGPTISRVEEATLKALNDRKRSPGLGGLPIEKYTGNGHAIYTDEVGYVQSIDMETLQEYAVSAGISITVLAVPGTFASPGKIIAFVDHATNQTVDTDSGTIAKCFTIGENRIFDDDPRFGLITLSEIASRALSPAVNDPGTAISIIGVYVRLFTQWINPIQPDEAEQIKFDKVKVLQLSLKDMFDDSFMAIGRDGAGTVEVGIRLQKAFQSLASINNKELQKVAMRHSKIALARAEKALDLPYDLEVIKKTAIFTDHHDNQWAN
ncbi:DUF2254 domain-containing protein [Pontibacter aydingkolensis]|uniref:DUF2254 domain-containing protein n=2 Tax=Pontibacter aydingkolensis TaxID=1911536 RepID=A0ABS7D091_9BACT|nr:DUF2254 domain-containing protein [Pontibacter aydingkolensis]